MKAFRSWLVGVGLALGACGGAAGVTSNSETHFLGLCAEDSCGDGLSCICGVCTVTCDPARSCGALHPDAICTVRSSSSCGDAAEPSVCDVDCDDDDKCSSLGSDYRCQDGFCRPQGCSYDGQSYGIGEDFPATDGCNTCTCSEDGVLCSEIGCTTTCEYDGTTYDVGEEFPAVDGCNSCSCNEDGVACTLIDCGSSGTCEYDGTTYDIGEEFPATDGCNTCGCTEDGVLCTEIGCLPPTTCEYGGTTYDVGEEFPAADGCNACGCTEDGVVCTDSACAEGCQVGDRFYEYGDSFLADDGCNSCYCDEEGGGCGQSDCSRPECLMPFEVGECDAAIPVYYYDAQSAQCEERIYGGCGGNDNNFATLEDCQSRCREFDNGG